jgi:hypothetical protein
MQHHACVQVGAFERCGGRSSPAGVNAPDPSLCCESGSLCKFYNKYFWQCQPKGYVPLPEPPAAFDDASCSSKAKVGLAGAARQCSRGKRLAGTEAQPARCCCWLMSLPSLLPPPIAVGAAAGAAAVAAAAPPFSCRHLLVDHMVL